MTLQVIVDVPVNKKSNRFTRQQTLSAFQSSSSFFIINHNKLLVILVITLQMLNGVVYRTSYLRPLCAAMFHNSYTHTFISSCGLQKHKLHQTVHQLMVRNNINAVKTERQRPRHLVQQHTVSFLNLSQRDTNMDDSRSNNNNSFMNRLPDESDDAYFRRIVTIASNPQSFENAVLKNDENKHDFIQHDVTNNITNINATNSTNTGTKSKYVRAEEWDAEEKRKMKSGSWEERVQFDGQLYGNRVNQNEILRQHLKGF